MLSMLKKKPVICAVDKTLHIMGSRWTSLLLHNLFTGKKRFGEFQRAMGGISSKTLSLRLHELEEAGIITKKVFPEVPLHIEYSLTKKGKSLNEIFAKMAEWGKNH